MIYVLDTPDLGCYIFLGMKTISTQITSVGWGVFVWRVEGRRSVERDASLQIISTIYTTFLHSYINFSCDIYDNPSILLFRLYSLLMSNCVGRE
jgi:hypothetical protein